MLESAQMVVMGLMKTLSKGGTSYVLTFVDDHSRYVAASFLESKSELSDKAKARNALHERQWGERIKCLRSDMKQS